MKILILTGDYPTSDNPFPGIFVHNQAKALKAHGANVSVLRFDVRSPRKKRPLGFSVYEYDGITVYRYSIPCGPIPHLLPFVSVRAALAGFSHVKRLIGKPDLIHAHFFNAGACAAEIKRKYGVAYVITEHGSGILPQKCTPEIRKQCVAAYAQAQKLIAVSGALRTAMNAFTDAPITVIPNILSDRFLPKSPTHNDHPFTFVSAGFFNPAKRFDLLLSAFTELCRKYPEIRLKIVGTGVLDAPLRQQAAQSGYSARIIFTGAVNNNEMPQIYQSCDCFVLPSEYETFGVVYAEAAACGLPIIATDCGGPSDIVTPENGLLIPVNDKSALIAAMEQMFLNRSQYDPAVISAQTRKKFGEEVIADSLFTLYREICYPQSDSGGVS